MNERERRIVELLCRHGELTNEQLAELLGVSASSVRRDLLSLNEPRFVERTHGGACLSSVIRYDSLPTYRLPLRPDEVRAIAARAAQFIEPGDIVAMSGGQICTQLARHIALMQGITVVTNAVNIAAELAALPGIKVMMTGGYLNRGSFELVGQAVALSLNGVHIHKFFLGTNGLSVECGVTNNDEAEALAARVLMERADSTMVLADSSKFTKASFAQVAPISAIDAIITTDWVPAEVIAQFEQAGTRLLVERLR